MDNPTLYVLIYAIKPGTLPAVLNNDIYICYLHHRQLALIYGSYDMYNVFVNLRNDKIL